MTEDAQILIARLLAHQTLRREDKLVKRALSDETFRAEVDLRLKACGMKFLDNVYADHVTLALTRDSESKVFGTKETWQNNNFSLARDGVALLVVLWALIILPKRERQEAHQLAEEEQNDMFGKEKPMPRAEETSMGVSYRALLADFGDKLGKKTRMDMNLGQLARLGFIERKADLIHEGPLLDLMMDTDALKDRIINGALSDIFPHHVQRTPAVLELVPELKAEIAPEAVAAATDAIDTPEEE
ncbi:MAG: hypothetical protein Q7T62_10135 [Undibacterium sp.]|nr:hypothetical protein [Undibacterium sp.]